MCQGFNLSKISESNRTLHAKDVLNQIRTQIEKSSVNLPELALKLSKLERWIKGVNPGLLTRKKYVLYFLSQFILDSALYIKIAEASSNNKNKILSRMSPTDRFWFEELFPHWLRDSHDPKFEIWTRQLMSEKYSQNDEEFISCLAHAVKKQGGTITWRYILDLSMATDLLICAERGVPIGVQATTMDKTRLQSTGKYDLWELACCKWRIQQGILASLNPKGLCKDIDKIATDLLSYSIEPIEGNAFTLYEW